METRNLTRREHKDQHSVSMVTGKLKVGTDFSTFLIHLLVTFCHKGEKHKTKEKKIQHESRQFFFILY